MHLKTKPSLKDTNILIQNVLILFKQISFKENVFI